MLQGDIDLFGIPSLTARFTSWQGPPPPTVVVPKDVVPAYQQAEIDSLRVTSFLPLLADTPWKDFQLDQVLVIFQNSQLFVAAAFCNVPVLTSFFQRSYSYHWMALRGRSHH